MSRTVDRPSVRFVIGLALLAASLVVLAPAAQAQERTLRVPQDYATVQAAVDASAPGDLVLIDAGEYLEEVFVGPDHSGITIRGVDRNAVVFNGENTRGTAIEVNGADGVTLENMTAHDYEGNGFFWTSVDGYVGRYLTTYRVRVYGIYAFDSINGLFEHSYGSGSGDASYYVGQCFPCNAVLTDLTAEYSALGYSGTNAGGDLVIKDSLWQNNGTGILPNSLDSELYPPQRQVTITGNTLTNNSNADTPAKGLSGSLIGVGIGIAGGRENTVENNVVTDHSKYGIAILPLPDTNLWVPYDNVIRNNQVSNSGYADLTISQGSGDGNCFEGNDFEVSDPLLIEDTYSCGSPSMSQLPAGGGSAVSAAILAADFAQEQSGARSRPSYTTMPDAPPQPNMPGAAPAPAPTPEPTTEPAPTSLPATGGGLVLALLGLGSMASAVRLKRRED